MPSIPNAIAAFLAVLLPASLLAQSTPPADSYAEIPGTHVSLRIPEGFAVREGFPGLIRSDVDAFVLANEIEVPLAQVLADMTAEGMAADGVTLLRSDKVTAGGQSATLFHTKHRDETGEVRKWFLLFGGDTLTVMLAASAPAAMEEELGRILEQTLLTVKWFPDRVIDPYAGMGFLLRRSDRFVVRGRKPGGVLLTRTDAPRELTPAEPIVVVYSATSAAAAPLAVLVRAELTENPQFTGYSNLAERAVTISDLNGHEVVADAEEASTQTPVRILLVAVRGNGRDVIFQAVVAAENWEKYLPEFRSLVDSLQITAAGHSH
jgi:hypothetical protein